MEVSAVRYDGDLFILPFDHGSSFKAGLLGIRGRRDGFLATLGGVQRWADIPR